MTENGVLPARRSPASERLTALANGGVKVAAIDLVVDRLAAGDKALWR